MKPSFSKSELKELESLIKLHHEKCIQLKLGTKAHPDRLIPKHHIILHYVTSIERLGPPKALWVMRLEGFHKCVKMYANSTSSRKNILKSIADKLQLHNSQMYFENIVNAKTIQTSKVCNRIYLKQYALENELIDIPLNIELPCYYFIAIENIRFQLNDIVMTENKCNNPFLYNIFKIVNIFYIKKEIKFLVSKLDVKEYNEDIQMLEISLPEYNSYYLLDIFEIIKLPTNIKDYNGNKFVNVSNF